MYNNKSVSVVFPAYNEQANIVAAVHEFFATGVIDEIIVVDNNSKDRTAELVRTQTKAQLVSEPCQGYGSALTRGLKEARTDYVILSEPDGTFLGRDVHKLLAYAEDFDLVCGTRTTRELIWSGANMPFFLRAGNMAVAKWLEFLFNMPQLSDCGCTMRLIRGESLAKFIDQLTVRGSHFLPEMVILAKRAGLSMIEIPVNYKERRGFSKITGSFKGILQTGLAMAVMITRYRLSGRGAQCKS